MTWNVDFSKSADKFLDANQLSEDDVLELLSLAVRKIKGHDVNLDIRKLKGEWDGFFRIRKGRIRIIAEFDFHRLNIFIENIDWRGSVYK